MKIFSRLFILLQPFWGLVALSVFLGTATTAAWIALIATSSFLISSAALQPSIAELQVAIVGVRFFGISRGVLRYLERLVSHTVTFRLLSRLRVWFYKALEPLAPARLQEYRSGDIFQRIVTDVDTLQDFYVRVIAPPMVAFFASLGVYIFFGQYAFRFALALLAFHLIGAIGIPLITRAFGKKSAADLVSIRSNLNSLIVDSIQGGKDLIAFRYVGKTIRELKLLGEKYARSENAQAWVFGLQTGLMALVVNGAMVGLLVLAIPEVSAGKLDGVLLAVSVLTAAASFEAILPLPQAFMNLDENLKSASRLFEIINASPPVQDPINPVVSVGKFDIAVRGLNFSYAYDRQRALKDFSVDLPAGKKVAVVGPSGAGKSTIINLLLRYWEFDQGEILVNGVDIHKILPDDVRKRIAVVPQRGYLFNATIKENLLLANPEAAEEEIISAAKAAQIHEFILTLPQGYDTWIGEQGILLSGGQRQRIAVARALLKGAPLLALDEPTAHLDTVTERDLINTIFDISTNRTLLMATHRLIGLEAMDEILVLRHGRIEEQGDYQTLLDKQGLYWQMWGIQNQGI